MTQIEIDKLCFEYDKSYLGLCVVSVGGKRCATVHLVSIGVGGIAEAAHV